MNQRKINIQICRLMGWSYSGGWVFDKGNRGENVTYRLHEVRQQIKTKHCLMCEQPIGDSEWRAVSTLERFGQTLFEHVKCGSRKP